MKTPKIKQKSTRFPHYDAAGEALDRIAAFSLALEALPAMGKDRPLMQLQNTAFELQDAIERECQEIRQHLHALLQ